MYAYCMAAAHLELPHLRLDHHMISNVGAYGEGWEHIDNLLPGEACRGDLLPSTWDPAPLLPTFLHHCQGYSVEKYRYGKRAVPKNIMACDGPGPLVQPPAAFDAKFPVPPADLPKKERRPGLATRRHAFAVCTATAHVNAAAAFVKERMCAG